MSIHSIWRRTFVHYTVGEKPGLFLLLSSNGGPQPAVRSFGSEASITLTQIVLIMPLGGKMQLRDGESQKERIAAVTFAYRA